MKANCWTLLQSGSVPESPAFNVQPVTLNPLNTQQGNPSFHMEPQGVTPRSSSFRRTGSQARNSFRASAENRIPPFSADGQHQACTCPICMQTCRGLTWQYVSCKQEGLVTVFPCCFSVCCLLTGLVACKFLVCSNCGDLAFNVLSVEADETQL